MNISQLQIVHSYEHQKLQGVYNSETVLVIMVRYRELLIAQGIDT